MLVVGTIEDALVWSTTVAVDDSTIGVFYGECGCCGNELNCWINLASYMEYMDGLLCCLASAFCILYSLLKRMFIK